MWSRIKSSTASRGALLALAGTGVVAIVAGAPTAAQAAQAPLCPETALSQPFAQIEQAEGHTPNYYSLMAGGAFEAGETPWTLSGGASVASGGGVSELTKTAVKSSLELPKGGVAISPVTCVEPSDRTFRFLVHGEGGPATVTVSVVYEELDGISKVIALGVGKGTELVASPILNTGAHAAAKLTGGMARMSIRFESTSGTARIDDVYLDPRIRR